MRAITHLPVIGKLQMWMTVFVLAALLLAACAPAAAPTQAPAQSTEAPAATTAPTDEPTEEPTAESTEAVATEAAATEAMETEPAATEELATPAGTGLSEAAIEVVADPSYGEILVDGDGMTLYIFTKDEPNVSNCEGECLEKWPPLLSEGEPVLGEGVDPALVGSTELEDGSRIVTYNSWPLYYWYLDAQPGDTDGQAVGDVWWVISPEGEVIMTAPPEGDAAPAASNTDAAAGEATINMVNDPELGDILVDGNGMTLYMFTKDEPNVSNCAGECLENWPPLLTEGEPTLGEGVDAAMVGFTTLADGRNIVTYNGMPLYLWAKDTQPGDTTGQGVGEVWFVVAPDGTAVGAPAQQPAQPATPVPTQKPPKDSGGYDSDY